MIENTLDPTKYRTTQVTIPLYDGFSPSIVGYQQEEAVELLGDEPLHRALRRAYIQGGDKLIVYATTEGEGEAPGPIARVTFRRKGIDFPTAYTSTGDIFEEIDVQGLTRSWEQGEILTIPLEDGSVWSSDRRIKDILIRTGRRDRDQFTDVKDFVPPTGIEAVPLAFDSMFGNAVRQRRSQTS